MRDDVKTLGGPLRDAEAYCDAVFGLLTRMGRAHFDEEVTQLEHALQTAALAEADGASDELVIAALLHDVGHLLLGEREGELQHEKVGARFLVRRFGQEVAGPVALHVPAKRYLLALDPGYVEQLSDASLQSLTVQGGPFTPKEAARFIQLRHAPDAVALRCWDDRGKVPDRTTPDLAHWRPRTAGLLRRASAPGSEVLAGGSWRAILSPRDHRAEEDR